MRKNLKELIENDELERFELKAHDFEEWVENIFIRIQSFFVKLKYKLKDWRRKHVRYKKE